MLEVSLRSFLSEFNGSKFVVYTTLFVFSILVALKLDGTLDINYVFVFAPIWLGEMIVMMGFVVGVVGFCTEPPSRYDSSSRTDAASMCLTAAQHMVLIAFEVLCVYKLEFLPPSQQAEMSWSMVAAPLFVESILAMIVAVWSVRHDKSFEFEMFFSINVVQFVFIAFKMDKTLQWSWVVVFVPTWVLFSLGVVGTLYSLILSIFLTRSLHALQHHRRAQVYSSVCHLILAVPFITFFVLLASKLDALKWAEDPTRSTVFLSPTPTPSVVATVPPHIQHNFSAAVALTAALTDPLSLKSAQLPFIVVAIPLISAFGLLMFMSFGSPSGNTWWFAMRKPFCNFIFDAFPRLRQYANISYRIGVQEEPVERPQRTIEETLTCSGPARTLSAIRITTHLWSIENVD